MNRKAAAVVIAVMFAAGAWAQPPASERRIVVSIPDRKLALIEDGRLVKIYRVAVGARVSPSPSGEFRIINRIDHPGYYQPHKVILDSRNNPLGTRWIGLNQRHYGIHGTNQPESIGHAASHGCIRMRNADVEEFFALVRVGDVVEIHAGRDQTTAAMLSGAPQPAMTASAMAVAANGGM